MPCDPTVWDVTALRRLLCWARENERAGVCTETLSQYRVIYHTPSVEDCERLYLLEDTRR